MRFDEVTKQAVIKMIKKGEVLAAEFITCVACNKSGRFFEKLRVQAMIDMCFEGDGNFTTGKAVFGGR